jgi:type II secretory pathway pseudopilin PulG
VIAILGVLAATFLPDLLSAREGANEATTTGNMQRLSLGCETLQRKLGYYPPYDFHDPEGKLTFKADNGVNTGIESLVAFLSQSTADGADLNDFGHRLVNTDNDQNGAPLPLLGRSDRPEIADEWSTPLAYFSKTTQNGGFDKPQTIALPNDGPRLVAKAMRNPDGQPVGRKYQLLSAGKDQAFGTADDLTWPEHERQ